MLEFDALGSRDVGIVISISSDVSEVGNRKFAIKESGISVTHMNNECLPRRLETEERLDTSKYWPGSI